ncbi:hypothetical protein IAE57_00080 [Stenotrophomonas sp. S48]|uniref:hypothetical protein n=1 Tax=unclassified Stenotrophomonas TaxID=196198 RepID=UPI001900A840|nr:MULTISPECIES: hypothetical protein [unclassified Stenotrophomonas]MBK0024551.1 hypothetical protein [Stenotrophomonas sp. S48]MBK0046660.1 hypothetical protein [Stenotrophomonas sp. S49]
MIGAGDLCLRICARLVVRSDLSALCIAGRDALVGVSKAHFVASCGSVPVEWATLDAADVEQVATLIRQFCPDLIVHCASLHSPWLLAGRTDAVADAFRSAGFAAQLPAQLPLLISVMAAVEQTGFGGGVINCSYPDATQPILQALGSAPTIGVGNSGMIQMMLEARLRARKHPRRVHVSAHHSHVPLIASCRIAEVAEEDLPRIHLDGERHSIADLMVHAPALALSPGLNEITAAHAVAVMLAWLGLESPLATSAPGVQGMPGGWPVIVGKARIELDLPRTETVEGLIAYQTRVARLDGIEQIEQDGTVRFTSALASALVRWPALAEPLRPDGAKARHAQLRQAMAVS